MFCWSSIRATAMPNTGSQLLESHGCGFLLKPTSDDFSLRYCDQLFWATPMSESTLRGRAIGMVRNRLWKRAWRAGHKPRLTCFRRTPATPEILVLITPPRCFRDRAICWNDPAVSIAWRWLIGPWLCCRKSSGATFGNATNALDHRDLQSHCPVARQVGDITFTGGILDLLECSST